MRIVLVAPNCHSATVEGNWTAETLKQEVTFQFGLPVGAFWLQWGGRVLRDQQLSDLSQVHVCLSLPGGVYDPSDYALSRREMHQLICRRCYCRNDYSRRTCHKCGHPDLRGRKESYRSIKVSNPNRKT
jgi:ribosomal protein L40E